MTEPTRPGQPPPGASGGGGQRLLAYVGGGVLVLALAGVAWALRGPGQETSHSQAAGTTVSTSQPTKGFIGPKVSAGTPLASPTATVLGPPAPAPPVVGPVAPTTVPPTTVAPTQAPPTQAAPASTPPAAAAVPPSGTTVKPGAPAPRAASGGVATVDYHFRVHHGDTMWQLTTEALHKTGRSTTEGNVATFLPKFYAHNASTVGSDPDVIITGQELIWPKGL